MVKVETYLKTDDEFIPLAEFAEHISDPVYIEGAIELEMNGVKALTLELWDDVNQLWLYIAQGLIEITRQQEWSTGFPDQPITLTFRTDVRRQRITVEVFIPADKIFTHVDRSACASASYDEFITAMSEAAQKFFRRMAELVPEERADWEREIRELQTGVSMFQQR